MTSVEQQRKVLLTAARISSQKAVNRPAAKKLFQRIILPDDNDVPFTTFVLDLQAKYPKYLPPVGGARHRHLFYRYSMHSALFQRNELNRHKKLDALYPLFNMVNITMFHGVHRRNEFIKRKQHFNPGEHTILLNPIDSMQIIAERPRTLITTTDKGKRKLVRFDEDNDEIRREAQKVMMQPPTIATEEVGDGFAAIRLTADELYRYKQHQEFLDKQSDLIQNSMQLLPRGHIKDLHEEFQKPPPTDEELEDMEEAIRRLKQGKQEAKDYAIHKHPLNQPR